MKMRPSIWCRRVSSIRQAPDVIPVSHSSMCGILFVLSSLHIQKIQSPSV